MPNFAVLWDFTYRWCLCIRFPLLYIQLCSEMSKFSINLTVSQPRIPQAWVWVAVIDGTNQSNIKDHSMLLQNTEDRKL